MAEDKLSPSEDRLEQLTEKVSRFPTTPGVYIMKDSRSKVLYVGKAVNLRTRVRSYLNPGQSDTRILIPHLIPRTDDIDCIVTSSEAEALILENNLIKKHRPIFNVRLRDDKNYISLRVTVTEKWPRVMITRRYQNDGDLYFGPYGSASSVRSMLRVIKKLFPLRTCTNGFFKTRKRPCLEHDLGRCSAPCVDLISEAEYESDVKEVILFLRGKTQELTEALKNKMLEASSLQRYELAGRYRDQIKAVEKVFETQKAQTPSQGEHDVFFPQREGEIVGIQELIVREGKIIHTHCHTFKTELSTEEVLTSFLVQYYMSDRYIPAEIILPLALPESSLLVEWLREKKGKSVKLIEAKRGVKRELLEMARENVTNTFRLARSRTERIQEAMVRLAKSLNLEPPLQRIECYDISNFQGAQSVGSMVVFDDGEPDRGEYRKFKIKTVQGQDDFASMKEVLTRRFREKRNTPKIPDLIVIDGGKGQLSSAVQVLNELQLKSIPVIGLAKERRVRQTTERIFIPGSREPLPIDQDTPESLLLQHIRDEAHRFAIRYHRELRKKATLRTGLEEIPGVGKKKAEQLLKQFGSLKGLEEASIEALQEIVGPSLTEKIQEHFGKNVRAEIDLEEQD